MKTLADAMKRAAKLDGPSLRDAIAPDQGTRRRHRHDQHRCADRNAIGKKLVIEEIKNGQLTLKATIDPAKGGKVEMNDGPAPAPPPPTDHRQRRRRPPAATDQTH